MAVRGIDVHGDKGYVNFALVKASGIDFAYVKCTEGVSFNDGRYADNVLRARQAGLMVGSYHFARPDNNSPFDEARHFHSVMKTFPDSLPPALDFERRPHGKTPAQLTQWAQDFLNELRALGHKVVVFYTYPDYFHRDMGSPKTTFGGALLWWAEYGPAAHTPPGWPLWTWQYTSGGRVGGVTGPCDMDVFPDSMLEFKKSFGIAPPTFSPPWQVFDGATQIGAGRLITPALIMRISQHLRQAGNTPPYTARLLDGTFIANGKFWPPGKFTLLIARQLRAGNDVKVSNIVISPRKGAH